VGERIGDGVGLGADVGEGLGDCSSERLVWVSVGVDDASCVIGVCAPHAAANINSAIASADARIVLG
jgi:hypothetical protein